MGRWTALRDDFLIETKTGKAGAGLRAGAEGMGAAGAEPKGGAERWRVGAEGWLPEMVQRRVLSGHGESERG